MTDPRLRVVHQGSGQAGSAILAALDGTVEIRLPQSPVAWRHQLLALTLVELLGRLCPRIRVVGFGEQSADHRLPPGPERLAERVERARAIGIEPLEPGEPVVTVAIGDAGAASFYADGAGWLSYVGTQPGGLVGSGSGLPIGPLAAAARVGHQVIARLLADLVPSPEPIRRAYSSALTYRALEAPFEEPAPSLDPAIEAVLVGAGSVGGAGVYAYAHVPRLRGFLDIVDPEDLERRNLVRAILASSDACAARAPKVGVAAAALAHQADLRVGSHQVTITEFVSGRPRETTLPLVLSPVDSVASRREIQDALPADVIDAACSPTEATISGHVTDEGPCLYCLHLPEVLAAENIRLRLIARATGLAPQLVLKLVVEASPLTADLLRAIETARGLRPGSLELYLGKTLDELYRSELMYGEMPVRDEGGGLIAVASPFVTALTGFLMAGESLKAGGGQAYLPYRLGARGALPTQYTESIGHGPGTALLRERTRWQGSECLCRSTRRLRLLQERYRR